MRHVDRAARAAAVLTLLVGVPTVRAQETTHAVSHGGISVQGWMGKIDPGEAAAGQKLENAKLVADAAGVLHVTTGPAVAYWNPSDRATGNYTVHATFREPKYMNLNDHPHPYGVFIGGTDMGSDQQSYLYCAAYGNGSFIVRGFGPAPFRVNGRTPQSNAAIHTATGPGQPVTQDIAISVNDDKVSCSINGTVVGTYAKADVVGAGKLKSTDGIYGIRASHNTEVVVTGLTATPIKK